jgi:hypothetical protein
VLQKRPVQRRGIGLYGQGAPTYLAGHCG